MATPSCIRGPYRQKRRTPRQTRHNRSKRRLCESEKPPNMDIDSPTQRDNDRSEEPAVSPVGDSCDHINQCSSSEIENYTQKVYENASLSSKSSELAIRTFAARHHLTVQALDDLLQLVNIHLPKPNTIPSSVYTLEKNSVLKPVSVEAITHSVCPLCYTVLPSGTTDTCSNSNCHFDSSTRDNPISFHSVSISEQLSIILASK